MTEHLIQLVRRPSVDKKQDDAVPLNPAPWATGKPDFSDTKLSDGSVDDLWADLELPPLETPELINPPQEHAGQELEAPLDLLPRGHLGLLEELLEIPNLTDIFVNAPDSIWYEAAGCVQRSGISFASEDDVRQLAVRLITSSGSLLDSAHPSCDVQTVRGHRVHAVLPPLSGQGTVITIRLQPDHRPSLDDLQAGGMFSDKVVGFLRRMMEQERNFLISGGTGTGKTTLLNALLATCEHTERILTIEDTAELKVDHPHVVSLTSQEANAEGNGAVELSELIRQALRMRPSRLVLGECRGAEIADMLMAMNTGHRGTGGTLHANSASAVPARLYALGALAGMNREALTLQAATAFDLVLHIERQGTRRYLRSISALVESNGVLVTRPLCDIELGRRGAFLETWHEGSLG